jgi:hypothetical protein
VKAAIWAKHAVGEIPISVHPGIHEFIAILGWKNSRKDIPYKVKVLFA